MDALKVGLAIVAAMILAFAIYVVMEALSPDEYYASSVGLSIRECVSASITLGKSESEANAFCSRRVPKKAR